MRRIIHNTTAIAACLSLLAPHLAQAQPAAPEGGAQPAQQAQPKPPQQEPAQQPQAGQPAAPAPRGPRTSAVEERLKTVHPDELSPKEALHLVYELRDLLAQARQ